MFEGNLIHQIKIWGAFGVVGFLPAALIFGVVLKHICKFYPKVFLPYSKAIYIQFLASLITWLIMLVLIFISQFGGNRTFWISLNGILSILVAAFIYSKKINRTESDPIGYVIGLKLSALISLIAIVLKVPINLLHKIITSG